MDIKVNRSQAKSGAWVIGLMTIVGICLSIYVAVFESAETDGPIVLLLCVLLFGWLFICLINISLWLIKLSRFEGTLMTITETGIIDYWENPPRELVWDDIKYIKWQIYQSVSVALVIKLKKRPKKEIIRNWLGSQTLRYPRQYLTIPDHKIARFITK
ncbi:MAG: hypothetical protein COA91_01565 [Robiginitomaculum sp.]|nr:MAG: hypothetical protein COA91_01565 [Robiginitomaculum sp.]